MMDVARICVVIGRTRHKMVQAEIQEAAKRGARLIELRLDFLAKAPDFKRLLADKPCPMIATVRRPADGGRWGGTEEARRMLLRQAIVGGFDWVDLETDIADAVRRFGTVKRIVSYHNMREVPADLEKIHERMCQPGRRRGQDGRARPSSRPTTCASCDLMDKPAKPTVAFCMGDMGFCTPHPRRQVRRPVHLRRLQQGARHRPGHAVVRRAAAGLPLRQDQRRHAGVRRHRRPGGAQPQPADPQPRLPRSRASTPSTCRSACRAADLPTFLKEFDAHPGAAATA